jgi:hypothetical protein
MSGKLFDLLYTPPLAGAGPIDTLDVPVAGRGYSTLPFIFDLVNALNETKAPDSTRKRTSKSKLLPKDSDGSATVSYLSKTLRTVTRITSKEPTSLGLHPVIYFYTRGGAFSPWAFLAWSEIVNGMFESGNAAKFTTFRADFEDFLLNDKWVMTEITHKNGSGHRSTPWLARYWRFLIEQFEQGKNGEEVAKAADEDQTFSVFRHKTPVFQIPGESSKARISRATKTAMIWDAALPGAPVCHICKARVHRNSYHADHKIPKSDGGDARPSNAGLAHPYCDSNKSNIIEMIAARKAKCDA